MAASGASPALTEINRSFSASVLAAIDRPNRPMVVLFSLTALMAAFAIFVEPVRALFNFTPISVSDALSAAAALGTLAILEFLKFLGLRRSGAARPVGPDVRGAARK